MRLVTVLASALLSCAAPALAAIGSPVSLGTISTTTASKTRDITGVTVPAGAMIFVVLMDTEGLVPDEVTDSASNTYIKGMPVRTGSAGSVEMRAFYACNVTAMTGGTITGTFQAADPILKTMHASYTTGIATTSCADNQATPTHNTNTSPSITTGTLAQADEIVFGYTAVENGSTTTYTEASGFTTVSGTAVSDRLSVAQKIVSAMTAVTYAPTLGASRHWATGTWTFKGASSYPAGVVANSLQAVWDTQTTAGNTSTPGNLITSNSCGTLQGCSSVDANNVFFVGAGGTYTNNDYNWQNRVVWVDGTGTFNFGNNKLGRSTSGQLLLAVGSNSGAPTVNLTNLTADYTNITSARESGILCQSGAISISASKLSKAGLDFLSVNSCTATITGSYLNLVAQDPGANSHVEFIHSHGGASSLTISGTFFDGRYTTIPANSWTAFVYPEPNLANVTWSIDDSIMSGPPLQGGTTAGNWAMQIGTKPYISTGTFTDNAIVTGTSGYFSRDSNAKLTASGNVDLNSATAVTITGGTGTAIPEVSTAPTVTGTQQVGQVSTCSQGTWTNNSGTSYSYQRQRLDGYYQDIPGATLQTYTYQAGDSGKSVRCTVRATNAAGVGQYWTTGQLIAP